VEQIYEFLSRFSERSFVSFLNGVLGSVCFRKVRSPVKIVGSTSLALDLNLFREQKVSYKWGYSPGKGYYKGYKLILVKPVAFYLCEGSPHDSKLFLGIVENLRKRRILRNGDRIIADKGFCDDENYWKGILLHRVEPCIFPKKNLNVRRAIGRFAPFRSLRNKRLKRLYDRLFSSFNDFIKSWRKFKTVRSIIEDLFKVMKKTLSMDKVHRYTERSIAKFVAVILLLLRIIISLGFNEKKKLQALAEMGCK